MHKEFTGKTVFITGGASGIGASCASILFNQGANVAILDRSLLAANFQGHCLSIQGDVSNARNIDRAIQETLDRFGPLHVGINCAGITGPIAPLLEQDDGALTTLTAINLGGVYLAMKKEANTMRETGGGAIVNVASVFGTRSMEGFALYGATKSGVIGITQAAAVEFARHGIRVNAVTPGPVRTPFIGKLTAEDEILATRAIPQQRIGEPDEIAQAILWLASSQASYVTGSILPVDGGQSAHLAGAV